MTDKSTAAGTITDEHPSRYAHPDAPVWLLPHDRIIWSQGYAAALSASPSPPPSAGVDAVARAIQLNAITALPDEVWGILNKLPPEDLAAIFARLADGARSALTPAPTPVDEACGCVVPMAYDADSHGKRCPICEGVAKPTPVAGGEAVAWRTVAAFVDEMLRDWPGGDDCRMGFGLNGATVTKGQFRAVQAALAKPEPAVERELSAVEKALLEAAGSSPADFKMLNTEQAEAFIANAKAFLAARGISVPAPAVEAVRESECGFPFCSCAKRGVCAHPKEEQANG